MLKSGKLTHILKRGILRKKKEKKRKEKKAGEIKRGGGREKKDFR